MNVVPKAPSPQSAPTPSNNASDARSRAIAAMQATPPAGDQLPVQNANQISPEELSAIQSPSSLDKDETPAATEETEAPKAKEDPLSSQYATLARKERALRAQIQQFKAEQEKFKAESAAQKAPELDLSKYIDRERLKSDPMAIFDEVGLSYDELTQAVLGRSQMQTDPRITRQMEQMQAEIKAAREEAKAIREANENSQKSAYQQAVANIRAEAGKLAFTDPSFELIKATNSVSDVVELIEETYKADGILMSVEEACQAVEDHLLEEANKLLKVKKLQQRQGATAPATPVNNPKQPQTQKTLTNTMSASKPMSAKERAIAAFQGKLTK